MGGSIAPLYVAHETALSARLSTDGDMPSASMLAALPLVAGKASRQIAAATMLRVNVRNTKTSVDVGLGTLMIGSAKAIRKPSRVK